MVAVKNKPAVPTAAKSKGKSHAKFPKEPKKLASLGQIPVTQGADTGSRMALLLWGPATCGKTTFAATAPGNKLWLSFGDNEHVSVMHRKDVFVANVSDLSVDDLFKQAQSDNPFGLDTYLAENEHIETVVCDSTTALAFRALQKSVKSGVGAGRGFTPTMEAPGISAYGGRNAILLETLTGLLRITAKYNVHIIITAHEDDPTMRNEGGKEVIDYISIMLGGKLVNNMTWRLSEIWWMTQETTGDRSRTLAVRPTRTRRPMKTRMFSGKDLPSFTLNYDADKPDDAKGQMTIANWYNEWVDGGYAKLAVPGSATKLGSKK